MNFCKNRHGRIRQISSISSKIKPCISSIIHQVKLQILSILHEINYIIFSNWSIEKNMIFINQLIGGGGEKPCYFCQSVKWRERERQIPSFHPPKKPTNINNLNNCILLTIQKKTQEYCSVFFFNHLMIFAGGFL